MWSLSTRDNDKLLQQLKSGFKATINWGKYQSDIKAYAGNQYLSHLVDPRFQGVNRIFVLSFEDENGRTLHSEYYLPKVEVKDYNVKIDGNIFFDQPITIRKIATGQGDDYMTCCLLGYPYFKENYKNDCNRFK